MRPHHGRVKEEENLPPPAGHSFPSAPQVKGEDWFLPSLQFDLPPEFVSGFLLVHFVCVV